MAAKGESMDYKEELLYAWIKMSVSIRGNRILSERSFNESVICSMLYRQQEKDGKQLTATDICERTKLLKSQVNRILNEMERQEMIERIRSKEDKRKIYISLKKEYIETYLEEHAKVMRIMDVFSEKMGKEKMKSLTALMCEAVTVVDEYHENRVQTEKTML